VVKAQSVAVVKQGDMYHSVRRKRVKFVAGFRHGSGMGFGNPYKVNQLRLQLKKYRALASLPLYIEISGLNY